MPKRLKIPKSPRKEGADSALDSHARSANPYPHSNAEARDEWFAGYDAALNKSKPKKA